MKVHIVRFCFKSQGKQQWAALVRNYQPTLHPQFVLPEMCLCFEANVSSYKNPIPERRQASCKMPNFTSRKGPCFKPPLTGPSRSFSTPDCCKTKATTLSELWLRNKTHESPALPFWAETTRVHGAINGQPASVTWCENPLQLRAANLARNYHITWYAESTCF